MKTSEISAIVLPSVIAAKNFSLFSFRNNASNNSYNKFERAIRGINKRTWYGKPVFAVIYPPIVKMANNNSAATVNGTNR